jgi:hypothetical protein
VKTHHTFLLGLLLLAGVVMAATNSHFTFFDDETSIIHVAGRPTSEIMQSFAVRGGPHRHPPLYDLILAGWMHLTSGHIFWLRVPAVIFYLTGVWFLSLAAEMLGGPRAALLMGLIGVAWPYGFQFGRIAGWYSLSFLGVALLTFTYLKFRETQNWKSWALLVASALILIYTNYVGWAYIALLALHFWWEKRRAPAQNFLRLLGTLGVVFLLFLPLAKAFLYLLVSQRAAGSFGAVQSLSNMGILAAFHMFSIYVSESVAPWFLFLSIPVATAVLLSLWVTWKEGPRASRVLLGGFALIFTAMSVTNLMNTKVLLLVAPWLLLAVGLALGVNGKLKFSHGAALLVIALLGWFGIFSKQYYSTPRLIEPWDEVAQQAQTAMRDGAIIVGNSPAFFFYLTYFTDKAATHREPDFQGIYPAWRSHPQIFAPDQWLEARYPTAPKVLLVKGVSDPSYWKPTAEAQRWLDSTCILRDVQKRVPDAGAALKEKYFPRKGQLEWRIEVREYACDSVSIQQSQQARAEKP